MNNNPNMGQPTNTSIPSYDEQVRRANAQASSTNSTNTPKLASSNRGRPGAEKKVTPGKSLNSNTNSPSQRN